MTKQEKIQKQKKYAKRQTILLTIIGVLLSVSIIIIAVIFLTTGGRRIQDSGGMTSGVAYTDTSDTSEVKQADAKEGATDTVDEINFKSATLKLKVGEKASPEVVGGKLSDLENWNSNDAAVVTVSDKGELTGVSVGTAEVTASVKNGYSLLKLAVEVTEPEPVKDDDTGMEGAVVTGTTANGYKIYEKDGCTYIDGILMASKTFTLPEDYAPGWEPVCEEAFNNLSSDAAKEGLDIYASSTFRSYEDQDRIYNNYVARDGQEAADTYSSRPGHSDHQTGLALDVNSIDDSFGYTPESDWLAVHAHEYGFIIRYPEGKAEYTGYQYEPWHIRYIGVDKATEVYKSGLSLEEFLGVDSKYSE